jgi:multidrug efflux pump subunit AcrB
MTLTAASLRNPAGVLVGVLLACALGAYAFFKLPIQLFPDIEEPVLTVFTSWRAAAPAEVESEIIEPQERALQGMPGLKELNAWANGGGAWINLRFAVGTDMQATLVEVISRMNQLPPMPRDAQAPVISLGEDGGGGPNQTLSWFFVQLLPGTPGPIESYRQKLEDVVRPRIEAVPGVAGMRINAGAPEELQIIFDPRRAAELGVEIPRIAAIAGNANDVSGGFVDIGRRQYTVRFAGRYTPAQLSELVLDWRDGRPVKLGDVATVEVRRGDRTDLAMQNGNPAIGIQIMKENGANVLDTLAAVKAEVEQLRTGPLAALGLSIAQSFDPSVFIGQAIDMVTGNLLAGVLLAVAVLWLFVRDRRATLLVGLSIPICLLVTLAALEFTGRTLNVISMAGLAFGVGQALDTAIVVLEAIARKREQGLARGEAALAAAKQVWPALLASTVTAVIVFLPLVFMQDAASQLFADLALTISIAVVASLIVSVTVLPVAASRWLGDGAVRTGDGADSSYARLANLIVAWTDAPRRRYATIAALLVAPAALTWLLLPPLDYLPPVKRDAIDGFFQFPPGASVDTIDAEIVREIARRMDPYMKGEREPALKNYYMLVWPGGGGTIGARPLDPDKIGDLGQLINEQITAGFPDTQVFASQGNLFGGFGDGRNIDFQLQSSDFEALLPAARRAQEIIQEKLPGAQVQALQGLELAEPELRLTPDDRRVNEIGWSRAEVGTVVRALGDGVWVGEHFDGERRLDMILRSRAWSSPEELAGVPVATPAGAVVPLGELVAVDSTVGPSNLRRVDGRRTVGLNVSPPKELSLQQAIDRMQREVEPEVRKLMPADGGIRYAGNAGNLKTALANMRENLMLAFFVLFLVMAALFRSAKASAFVMLTIPLASFGGVLAIWVLRLFTNQTLDLLTMIGFVVLMGLVVNNAILLTDEARAGERAGLTRREAVAASLRTRTRPIFSITMTTLCGMLPLVIVPGAGSALYRGLATVIVGGMALNAVFTLVLLPALLRLGETAPVRVPAGAALGAAPAG